MKKILRKILLIIASFNNREIVITIAALMAVVFLYFLLFEHLYKDTLPLLGFLFTIFVTVYQWYESKKEKDYLKLSEIKKEFYSEIKILENRFDEQDRKSESEDNAIRIKVENTNNNLDNHLKSIGHDHTVKEFIRFEKELLTLQVLVSMQTKYAELIKIIEKMNKIK